MLTGRSIRWFAISFSRTYRLRLIGAPPDLILGFREMLNSLKMFQSESWKDQRVEALEFKLYVSSPFIVY